MVRKTIYFICSGTSINDIIHSINKLKKTSKRSIVNFMYSNEEIQKSNKAKLHNDPSLIKLGMKQLSLFQENKENRLLLQNFKRVYTSLDTCSIESALILYKHLSNTIIFPLSHMITNKDIFDIESLIKFKGKFGKIENNKTRVSGYSAKNNNLKKINGLINWQFISSFNTKNTLFKSKNSILSNAQFGFHAFEKELIYILKFDPNESILIVSHHEILIKILERCKSTKFYPNKNNIEVTSLWKIDVEYTADNITFLTFEKIFPTTSNYKPLESVDNKFTFLYQNIKYTLFNSGYVPEEYLKFIYNKSLPSNIKNKLVKINSSISVNKESGFSIDNFK